MAQSKDIEFDVRWLPYQLAPQSSEEPRDKAQMYMEKFGRTREQVKEMANGMAQNFAKEGLPYYQPQDINDPSQNALVANTLQAHRVLAAAFSKGGAEAQDKAAEIIFHGYFGEGKAPNDVKTLEDAAEAAGLDRGVVQDRSQASAEVTKELAYGRSKVTQGVPHFMISKPGGKPVEFSGAQSPDVFSEIFNKVAG
jgi:predicted DsbA family dithiol-disulfide isomerase